MTDNFYFGCPAKSGPGFREVTNYAPNTTLNEYIAAKNQLNRDDNNACIGNKEWKEFVNFKKYFEENVILVCVEIPEDTDVASYFEIMNNRGAQLQDHEIIKARLMSKIKSKDGSGFDLDKQRLFALVWDACSQMDCHVQENFNAPLRRKLFSTNYDSFKWDVDEAIEGMNEELDEQDVVGSDSFNEPKSINDLIDDDKLYRKYL